MWCKTWPPVVPRWAKVLFPHPTEKIKSPKCENSTFSFIKKFHHVWKFVHHSLRMRTVVFMFPHYTCLCWILVHKVMPAGFQIQISTSSETTDLFVTFKTRCFTTTFECFLNVSHSLRLISDWMARNVFVVQFRTVSQSCTVWVYVPSVLTSYKAVLAGGQCSILLD